MVMSMTSRSFSARCPSARDSRLASLRASRLISSNLWLASRRASSRHGSHKRLRPETSAAPHALQLFLATALLPLLRLVPRPRQRPVALDGTVRAADQPRAGDLDFESWAIPHVLLLVPPAVVRKE